MNNPPTGLRGLAAREAMTERCPGCGGELRGRQAVCDHCARLDVTCEADGCTAPGYLCDHITDGGTCDRAMCYRHVGRTEQGFSCDLVMPAGLAGRTSCGWRRLDLCEEHAEHVRTK